MDQDARPTGRETLPVIDSVRNVAKTKYKVRVYNVDEIARRTHRETTTDSKNPSGFVGAQDRKTGAYVTTVVDAPMTQKAAYSAVSEHFGGAGSKVEFRQMDKAAYENAEIDGTREMMLAKAGYTPNAKGANVSMDAGDVSMDAKRLVADDLAARDTHNMTRISNAVKPVEKCEVTKPANELPYSSEQRLDPTVLSSLRSNPYKIFINPINMEC